MAQLATLPASKESAVRANGLPGQKQCISRAKRTVPSCAIAQEEPYEAFPQDGRL
jgi:hypothetical protein